MTYMGNKVPILFLFHWKVRVCVCICSSVCCVCFKLRGRWNWATNTMKNVTELLLLGFPFFSTSGLTTLEFDDLCKGLLFLGHFFSCLGHTGATGRRGAHLGQNFVQPLQGTVQMQLDPARSACDGLPPAEQRHKVVVCSSHPEMYFKGNVRKKNQNPHFQNNDKQFCALFIKYYVMIILEVHRGYGFENL